MKNKYFWKRKIIYKEYDKSVLSASRTRLGNPINEDEMTITSFRLAKDIVKSMITKQNNPSFANAEFLCWFLQLGIMTTEDNDGYLELSPEVKSGIFRDFSDTSRCGELAQGINYSFCMRKLKARSIEDFKHYVKRKKLKIPPCLNKTYSSPDYIIKTNNRFAILESKGDYQDTYPTSLLREVKKNQCLFGAVILRFNNIKFNQTFASVIKFRSKKSANREVCIHYGDPQYYSSPINIELADIRREYSKWFDIMEKKDMAMALRENRVLEFDEEHYESVSGHNVIPLNKIQYNNGKYCINIEIGITQYLMRLLSDINISLEQFMNNELEHGECVITENDSFFDIDSDGTYLKAKVTYNV